MSLPLTAMPRAGATGLTDAGLAAGSAGATPSTLVDHISPFSETSPKAVSLSLRDDLFENQHLQSISSRALTYLRAGVPVHLRGPAGTGKTTMAMQTAARLGRPVIIVRGDGSFTASNLVGREAGTKSKQTVDRYIHSVKKIETETTAVWSDDALTEAIVNGYTLVYDEFTRSPPQANNPLLTAFEERMLILAGGGRRETYVRAHPEFRSILTSNPDDYAGVMSPQDALVDRMITFDLDCHDRDTEIGIVANRSGLEHVKAARIVDIVRAVRDLDHIGQTPSMRTAIMVARIVALSDITPSLADGRFIQLLFDVICSKLKATPSVRPRALETLRQEIVGIVETVCSA